MKQTPAHHEIPEKLSSNLKVWDANQNLPRSKAPDAVRRLNLDGILAIRYEPAAGNWRRVSLL